MAAALIESTSRSCGGGRAIPPFAATREQIARPICTRNLGLSSQAGTSLHCYLEGAPNSEIRSRDFPMSRPGASESSGPPDDPLPSALRILLLPTATSAYRPRCEVRLYRLPTQKVASLTGGRPESGAHEAIEAHRSRPAFPRDAPFRAAKMGSPQGSPKLPRPRLVNQDVGVCDIG